MSGFTLVEPLVVIAVIAVLAAVAFLSFQRITDTAKVVKKFSSLRSIAISTRTFSGDNNGWIFPVEDNSNPGNERNWRALLADYLSGKDLKSAEANRTDIFTDPLFKAYNGDQGAITGYAMNIKPGLPGNDNSNRWSADVKTWESRFKTVGISLEDRRMMIVDSDNGCSFNSPGKPPESSRTATRHRKGKEGLFLMYGGNVERLALEQAVIAAIEPAELIRHRSLPPIFSFQLLFHL